MEEAQRESFLAKVNNGDKEAIKQYITEVFGNEAGIAIKIAQCESGLNPNAYNGNVGTGDNSVGIFQINILGALAKSRPSKDWLLIATNNIDYAYQMYSKQGWAPWSCKKVLY